MLACGFDWCACPYQIADGGLTHGLGTGCTKFSAALRAKYPDLMRQAGVPGEHDPEPPEVYWVVDMRLSALLMKEGYLPHGHQECTHAHTHNERELAWLAGA